jgi:hypothetical protein
MSAVLSLSDALTVHRNQAARGLRLVKVCRSTCRRWRTTPQEAIDAISLVKPWTSTEILKALKNGQMLESICFYFRRERENEVFDYAPAIEHDRWAA